MVKRKTIGSLEKISFPEFNMSNVVAKIDTGAYTGAIHCTHIKEEKTENGAILQFSPFDNKTIKTTEKFKVKPVTSSNGKTEMRYFIDTEIVIDGEKYPIRLSLANRNGLKWPVLIGRRFLRMNNLLVDVKVRNK